MRMLDLRFIWDDAAPSLVACSGGLKHVLLEASVVHHLPVVTHAEMNVLLKSYPSFYRRWIAVECGQVVPGAGPQTRSLSLGRPCHSFKIRLTSFAAISSPEDPERIYRFAATHLTLRMTSLWSLPSPARIRR